MDDQSEIPEKSKMQRGIEDLVTSGKGYDWSPVQGISYRLLNYELGLQIALMFQDIHCGRIENSGPKIYGHLFQLVNCLEMAGLSLSDVDSPEIFASVFNDPVTYSTIPEYLLR